MMCASKQPLIVRVAIRAVVPLAMAGLCMAPAPAPAVEPTPSSGAEQASAAAADSVEVSLGGVSMSVPAGWSVVELGGAMTVASSQDGAMSAGITSVGADELEGPAMPSDDSGRQELFETAASDGASNVGGSVVASQTATFSDGTPGYLYVIDASGADEPAVIAVAYIPMRDGSLCTVTLAADPGADGAAETLDQIITTIDVLPAGPEGTSASAGVELPVAVEAAGISFDVPEGMQDISDEGSDQLDLASEDGELYLSAIPDVFGGAGLGDSSSDESLDSMVDVIASGLGGEVLGSTTLESGGVETRLYAFVVSSDDGEKLLGSLGFIQVADGTTTCLMGLCAAEGSDIVGEVLDAVYASVALL